MYEARMKLEWSCKSSEIFKASSEYDRKITQEEEIVSMGRTQSKAIKVSNQS